MPTIEQIRVRTKFSDWALQGGIYRQHFGDFIEHPGGPVYSHGVECADGVSLMQMEPIRAAKIKEAIYQGIATLIAKGPPKDGHSDLCLPVPESSIANSN